MIIKIIHLMNLANADTLTPIIDVQRPGTVRVWGCVRSQCRRSRKPKKLARRQFAPEKQCRPEVSDLRLAAGPAFLL